MFRVLIVDDEVAARRELRAQLGEFANVKVCGEAADAAEALALLQTTQCDILFLDIEMPGINGIELARRVKACGRPHVVFVTAYPQYALDAFEVGAAGYLLKPFDEERLGAVLERISGPGRERGHPAAGPAPGQPPRIHIDRGDRTMLIDPREIAYAYLHDERVYLKLKTEHIPCSLNLHQLGERLQHYGFVRVHRRFLVNLEQVRGVVPYFKGGLALVVRDAEQTEIPVSRNMAPQLRQRLGLIPHGG